MKPFVVTGSGHSGTAWLARAFAIAGLAATHEGVYQLDGRRPWPSGLAVDVSLAAMPYLADPSTPCALVVVRDPLAVLNSFYRGFTFADSCTCHAPGAHLGSPFVQFVRRSVDVEDGDELARTMRYLVAWHDLKPPGVHVARLEDIAAGQLRFWAQLFGGVPRRQVSAVLAGPWLPSDVNAHGPSGPEPRRWITWPEIRARADAGPFVEYAERLGYFDVPVSGDDPTWSG